MRAVRAGRSDREVCRCGHERAAHEHYRGGSECALCPSGECRRFRSRTSWLRRLFGR